MIETELLHHGYLFVFLGTIFEEDSRLLTSTFLAHRGYLHFSWVLIIAAMSTVAANQAYFLIARRTGVKWLDTASAGSRKIETVITWSHQHITPPRERWILQKKLIALAKMACG